MRCFAAEVANEIEGFFIFPFFEQAAAYRKYVVLKYVPPPCCMETCMFFTCCTNTRTTQADESERSRMDSRLVKHRAGQCCGIPS